MTAIFSLLQYYNSMFFFTKKEYAEEGHSIEIFLTRISSEARDNHNGRPVNCHFQQIGIINFWARVFFQRPNAISRFITFGLEGWISDFQLTIFLNLYNRSFFGPLEACRMIITDKYSLKYKCLLLLPVHSL